MYTDLPCDSLAKERSSQVLAIFIRDTGSGETLDDPTGDGFDKISLRSAPSSLDTPGEFPRLTPLNTAYSARSRRTPLSAGPKSADYFSSKPITAEPEPLIDSDSPTPTTAPLAPPIRPWSTHSNAPSFKSKRSSYSMSSTVARMTDAERKRYELQMRLYKARALIPFQITLRVFRSPLECVETWGLLDSHFEKNRDE